MKALIPALFLLISWSSVSQEVQRSTLSAAGSSVEVESNGETLLVQQSVGQQSVIGTYIAPGVEARQGFIQPPISVKGISVEETDIQAVVYPNPFESSIQVKFGEVLKGELSIQVYDLLGRTVYEAAEKAAPEITIGLEHLSQAEYVLLITSENKQFKATLLKN